MSQQDVQFSQYMLNKLVYNPGFTGIDEVATVNLVYRDQWMGFDGAPGSQYLSFDTPSEVIGGGAGISILNDRLGSQRTTSFGLNYAFRMIFKTPNKSYRSLSAGFGLTLNQMSIDGSVFRAPDGDYSNGQTNHNDPFVPNGVASDFNTDLNFGVYYLADDKFLGTAVTHLMGSPLQVGNVITSTARNFNLMAGKEFKIHNYYSMLGSFLYKTTFKKSQLDLNLNMIYNNEVWIGVGMRGVSNVSVDGVIVNIGAHLTNAVSLGYSYDATASGIGTLSGGTHEFLLKYRILNFMFGRKPIPVEYCPRFM